MYRQFRPAALSNFLAVWKLVNDLSLRTLISGITIRPPGLGERVSCLIEAFDKPPIVRRQNLWDTKDEKLREGSPFRR